MQSIQSMNPYIPSEEGMGEKYRLALKAEAETKDKEELLWELVEYRYNLQKMVDELWDLKEVPSKSQLHAMFYDRLTEEKGYRAHVARNMYKKRGNCEGGNKKWSLTCANIEKTDC